VIGNLHAHHLIVALDNIDGIALWVVFPVQPHYIGQDCLDLDGGAITKSILIPFFSDGIETYFCTLDLPALEVDSSLHLIASFAFWDRYNTDDLECFYSRGDLIILVACVMDKRGRFSRRGALRRRFE
jgi:hypothetical protein